MPHTIIRIELYFNSSLIQRLIETNGVAQENLFGSDLYQGWRIAFRKVTINRRYIRVFLIRRVSVHGVTKKTANHTLAAIAAFFNFCLKRELVRANPAIKAERFKIPIVPQHYLKDQQEVERLLEAAKREDQELYPMIVAGVLTGCRLGELMGLEWEDIDFAMRKIVVRDKPHLGLRTKSGKFRVVPLHPDLLALLMPMRKERGFVLLPHRQERKYTTPLQRRWRRIRQAAGLPKETTWYSLRRTFCSHLAMSGVSLLKIQRWAGHSDPRITERHYAFLSPDYDPEIERIRGAGYISGDSAREGTKRESHYPLGNNGLRAL